MNLFKDIILSIIAALLGAIVGILAVVFIWWLINIF